MCVFFLSDLVLSDVQVFFRLFFYGIFMAQFLTITLEMWCDIYMRPKCFLLQSSLLMQPFILYYIETSTNVGLVSGLSYFSLMLPLMLLVVSAAN